MALQYCAADKLTFVGKDGAPCPRCKRKSVPKVQADAMAAAVPSETLEDAVKDREAAHVNVS